MPPEAFTPHRRALLAGALATAGLGAGAARADDLQGQFRALEARTGARLGLYAAQTGGGDFVAWRADERFLMCSTFKALAVAAVLARVDRGAEHLDRFVPYAAADLLSYAPVAKANLAKGGMSLGELCAAAVELSDNTAANLILAALGGPAGVTRFIRAQGDQITRLDRNEPALNLAPEGDPRDSTTPASMVGLWRRILLKDALSAASRKRLTDWLLACRTGPDRLPTITPKGWTIGHKTGSGDTTIGDVAILTPPDRPPILMAVYLDGMGVATGARGDAALAEAGRIALRFLVPSA